MAEKIDYKKFYVAPHKVVSLPVESEEELRRVNEAAPILAEMCHVDHGMYPSAFAVAHSQINDIDPLRFFVDYRGLAVINPVITRHTEHVVKSREGCMSFPDRTPIDVWRWNKIEGTYQTIGQDGKLTEVRSVKLSGREARVWQHEIDHMNCKYIYDEKTD
jgi:hypothetical protein